ncbi:MAG: alanine--glyoxylate aminotransferase family protein [Eubacteriales bacterium]|nr:alanine--glyoxylate aminotransferase family protein [Eubacteriales bacterium]MDD3866655.1 alanine--glyoxylate aminotransferase family protein [Eubacteriales bacterium]
MNQYKPLTIPERILMGPGPSDVAPSVLRAMASPLLGHLDPVFMTIMNEIMAQLRDVFATENKLTMPMSGTGSAGMETAFVNVIEPGDVVIVGVKGVFGQRMVDVAQRCGARVVQVEAPWGEAIRPEQIEDALKREKKVKAVAIVHAETSTGVRQPLAEIGRLAHAYDALYIVDAVTSLGGIPVDVDDNGIDVCYSGTQKCISAPPGLAPVTLNERAAAVMAGRKTKVQSWYLDLNMIQSYWGNERLYHHTAPITMNYAIHEALRLILDEGLEACYERHDRLGRALQTGLEAMGLKLLVNADIRLPELTTVHIPDGVNDAAVRGQLLEQFGIEIGGGLGAFKGKLWRVGLMGHSCQIRHVVTFLAALEIALKDQGFTPENDGVDAAMKIIHG